ncbi:MAG: molybdopterin cofactor-binding domain-containing protein [Gammaproteobacteria bacterium]
MSMRVQDASQVLNLSRRGFLQGVAAGSLVLATGLPGARAAEPKKYGAHAMSGGLKDDPKVFLSIGEDGLVTLLCHRAEMGQGVRSSWAMVVADELEAELSRVQVGQSPGDEARYGNQNTDGSRSMRHHFDALRRIGASARRMLEEEAASRWQVPLAEVRAENHALVHAPSGRRLGFGELAGGASARQVPAREALSFKPVERFRYIGKEGMGLVDNFEITTGKARYGIDAWAEGMAFAVVARPPVYGARLKRFDASRAERVPGVLKVLPIDFPGIPSAFQPLGGVAVIAENTFAAITARGLLEIEWDEGPNAQYDSARYRETLEAAARSPGKVVRDQGAVDAALAAAARRVEASYYIPHPAHATMEPPSATACVTAEGCEVWCGVQNPETIRTDLTRRLGVPREKVVVLPLLLGGGFGRKSKPDFAIEAVILSRAMDGRVVKLTFTRDDDLHHGFFHTASVERIEAGLDASGRPVAWLHRTVAPTILSIFVPGAKNEAPFELGMGAVDVPFAIQSFAAELSAAAGRDPKDYLIELLGPDRLIDAGEMSDGWLYGEDPKRYPFDTGRLRRVIERVAGEAGWGRRLPKGHGLGIAAHRSFVSYAAAVVEVAVGPKGEVRVPRVDIAIDCGAVVNPDRVRSQLEGAVIQGLSLAMTGEISFRRGRVEQSNFHDYTIARIDEAPREIRTHLVIPTGYDSPLGGVGEPGVPPVAPALCNAIHAATGRRIRSLPIRRQLA